jgi:hypothetical protein
LVSTVLVNPSKIEFLHEHFRTRVDASKVKTRMSR